MVALISITGSKISDTPDQDPINIIDRWKKKRSPLILRDDLFHLIFYPGIYDIENDRAAFAPQINIRLPLYRR